MTCCGPKPTGDGHTFKADYRTQAVTLKFWSKHENSSEVMCPLRVEHYENKIEEQRKYDARCHSKLPRYTSQNYGWLPGYKIRFLQACDLNICQNITSQKLIKDLSLLYSKGQNYCANKKFTNADRWKIV